MAQYDNNNRGVMFVNDRKQEDWQPDRTGSATVDGIDYFVDGWMGEKNGKPYLQVRFKKKDKQGSSQTTQSQTSNTNATSEAPF